MNRRVLLTYAVRAFIASAIVAKAQTVSPRPIAPPAPVDKNPLPAEIALRVALITASVTIAGIVLKDLIFKVLDEHRANKRAESAVYDRYSKPLAASAMSLMFRLNEIVLQEHRPVYLKSVGIPKGDGQGSTFRAYKKMSTLYRLASLLGWVRACRREFSYVRLASKTESAPIDNAIAKFENALADGSWVERERVKRLCELWRMCRLEDLQNKPQHLDAIGVKVDNSIYDRLEDAQVEGLEFLDEGQKEALTRDIALLLAADLQTNQVSEASFQRTWPEAFNIIATREAWLYKDWQSAIGDMMLKLLQDENRRYEVLGYGEFELLCRAGATTDQRWIKCISDIFDEVDFSIKHRFDARQRQLRTLACATAEMVKALHGAQGAQSIVSREAQNMADTILGRITQE